MKRTFFYSLLMISFGLTGCGGARDFDYYSELKQLGSCDNLFPHATTHQINFEGKSLDQFESFITKDCFEDLKSFFDLDSSFLALSENKQMRILESAVVVFNTPLALPPKGSIFGHAITNEGTLSASLMCLFQPDISSSCPNYRQEEGPMQKFVFNYMMNNIDVLFYKTSNGNLAEYGLDDFLLNGRVTFSQSFLGTTALSANNVRTPYLRASTMVHEARHREAFHDFTGKSDDEVIGSYGFTLGYLAAVLYGSYNQVHPVTGDYLLSDYDVQLISGMLCSLIRDKITYIDPKLKNWTRQKGCWGPHLKDGSYNIIDIFTILPNTGHSASWWLKQSGLAR